MCRRQILNGIVLAGLLAVAGCQSCGMCGRGQAIPPGQLPPGAKILPPNAQPMPSGQAPPAFAPRAPETLAPQPLPPGAMAPAPAPSGSISGFGAAPAAPSSPSSALLEGVRMGAPEFTAPADEGDALADARREPYTPARPADPMTPLPASPMPAVGNPGLPVGIPRFAEVKAGVTTGAKPALDGLDWLQANGYKTVVLIRKPNDPDRADRQEIEKRDMRAEVLEVSVENLRLEDVTALSQLLANPERRPIFVYDNSGTGVLGAMWYLYLRTQESLDDATARRKAALLGYRPDGSDAAVTLELAVQRVLSELKK